MSDERVNLLTFPIDEPQVLDALWQVYQKSSDIAYPERVLTVLDRADGVRSRLESWLSSLPDDYDTTLDFDMYPVSYTHLTLPTTPYV